MSSQDYNNGFVKISEEEKRRQRYRTRINIILDHVYHYEKIPRTLQILDYACIFTRGNSKEHPSYHAECYDVDGNMWFNNYLHDKYIEEVKRKHEAMKIFKTD